MKGKKSVAQIFGDNLRRIRTEKGISRKDLAAALGVSTVTIGSYETGQKSPLLEKVYLLAEILGVSIVSLTGENDFSDSIPNVEKIIEEKLFEYRLQRAYSLARNCLDSLYNDRPNFDDKGHVVVYTPARIKIADNGVISYLADSNGNVGNSVVFRSKIDFVNIMEQAERNALRRQINFNAAFRQIVFGEEPPK